MNEHSLAGCHILIVEDEFLVALDLSETLQRIGARVTMAAPLSQARAVDAQDLDGAIIDYQLDSERTDDLARALRGAGVPVIIATGFDGGMLPEDLRKLPRLSKPMEPAHLARAVAVFMADTAPCDRSATPRA